MLNPLQHNISAENTTYFKELVSDYYPQRLAELETLRRSMEVMDNDARLPQLFLEKLIAEINTLWRAEKHYWSMADDTLVKRKFPKDYIVQKQRTISDLITHLRALLFTNIEQHDRKNVLQVLSDYIEIEYKLNGLLIEKEKRIYELGNDET